MKKRLSSFVTNTSIQPWPTYAFDHLQQAYTELFDALVKSKVGSAYDATKVYVLYGCVATTTGGTTSITAGAVFFNGEIYLSPAQSVTVSTGVLVADILQTFADPVGQTEYTDGTINQDCAIRTCAFSYKASGSGTLADYANFIRTGAESIAQSGVALNGTTYKFTHDAYYTLALTLATGANTITLDGTGLTIGKEVVIIVPVQAGATLSFNYTNGLTGGQLITGSTSATAASTGEWCIRMKPYISNVVMIEVFNY